MSEQIHTNFIEHTDSGALYNKPGLDLLLVQTPLCRAVIARQGAQLLEFQATDREPLLWLSPKAQFEPGKAVRGGIPLCLPWFGINRVDPAKPKHGLVRTQTWELAAAKELAGGDVELVFTFRHNGDELFAAPFFCEFTMRLGRELRLLLRLENLAEAAVEYSWAWHTYFPVESVREIEVHGLEHAEYLDNTRELARFRQEGSLTFPGEVDRVFENAPAHQKILTRNPITTHSDNCHSVITWNPGAELAATLADVGEHCGEFVCVEHGNAFADSWQLAAGEVAEAALTIQR
ncbi:glucose-6-phosphate 1-epimerase [Microbulbifer donghaiensis]|uniref:Putative glucose-6-phosphate 1-epimerase n=1 Tax=Microbulbifer donghaiensis TaxID=494016 RepID=A0A1M4YMJ9_9GAMM|nr:D-hexose-6-phosphate mutarotase [Microbulbifer donghaiensis]SHF06883.1 glucose-6-phosphate 1-epimerase [Microbulbifer donghaiensis]